jgi:hypothetical protein
MGVYPSSPLKIVISSNRTCFADEIGFFGYADTYPVLPAITKRFTVARLCVNLRLPEGGWLLPGAAGEAQQADKTKGCNGECEHTVSGGTEGATGI